MYKTRIWAWKGAKDCGMAVALKPCPGGAGYDALKPLFLPVSTTEVLQTGEAEEVKC